MLLTQSASLQDHPARLGALECLSGFMLSDEGGWNFVPDAWLAALAIEHGCEWITTDRDFARFPGLRWRAPG